MRIAGVERGPVFITLDGPRYLGAEKMQGGRMPHYHLGRRTGDRCAKQQLFLKKQMPILCQQTWFKINSNN